MLKYLIEKEFKQIRRNSFIPRIIVGMTLMMMLVMPWAANQEVRNIKLCVVDNDKSSLSGRLVHKLASSDYFITRSTAATYSEAMKEIEAGRADMILEIGNGFEEDFMSNQGGRAMISVNAVNAAKGGLGAAYLNTMLSDFAAEIAVQSGPSSLPFSCSAAAYNQAVSQTPDNGQTRLSGMPAAMPASITVVEQTSGQGYLSSPVSVQTLSAPFTIIPHYKFNPRLDYRIFMVPALMVMLLTLLCGFLPALNIVSEKEKGTIEQINVSPVGRISFVLAKLIPYWIMGFVVFSIVLMLAWWVYGLVPAGSLLTIYIFAATYILVVSAIGLVVSNYSGTIQQAMFLIFFFLIIFILMSGLFTPIRSMPEWAQAITIVNPLKYFMKVMRMIYLMGSSFGDLNGEYLSLCIFALAMGSWAVLSYRKRS